jgi:hypothetical protein
VSRGLQGGEGVLGYSPAARAARRFCER